VCANLLADLGDSVIMAFTDELMKKRKEHARCDVDDISGGNWLPLAFRHKRVTPGTDHAPAATDCSSVGETSIENSCGILTGPNIQHSPPCC